MARPAKGILRLGKRLKPLRRTAQQLADEAIVIDPADGPVRIDAERTDGRVRVRITPVDTHGDNSCRPEP